MSETISEIPQESQQETQQEFPQESRQELLQELKQELKAEMKPKILAEIIAEAETKVSPEIVAKQEKKNATAKTIVNNIVHHAFPPIQKTTSEQCVGYKFRWVDLILPPYEVLDTLCSAKDKTYMTIYTLIRLLILGILSFALYKYLPRDPVSETVIYLFIALVVVNLIFLGVIVSKTPDNTGTVVVQEAQQETNQESK